MIFIRSPVTRTLDHLVYAAPALDAAVNRIARTLGIEATPGGHHPGWGTRNALIALGPDVFLELIGPDPNQPRPDGPRPFGIDTLSEPRLVTWAAKATDLPRLVDRAADCGIALGPVTAGSRMSPGGVLLAWQFTNPLTVVADGIVPFFIDWATAKHPADTAPQGARFIGLRGVHPRADAVRAILAKLEMDLRVDNGDEPELVATIDGPLGRVELR